MEAFQSIGCINEKHKDTSCKVNWRLNAKGLSLYHPFEAGVLSTIESMLIIRYIHQAGIRYTVQGQNESCTLATISLVCQNPRYVHVLLPSTFVHCPLPITVPASYDVITSFYPEYVGNLML